MSNSSQSQDVEHQPATPNTKRPGPDTLQPSAQGELDREAEPDPQDQVDDGSKLFPDRRNTRAEIR